MPRPVQPKPMTRSRQTVLIDMNSGWLRQALDLLDRLDDTAFSTSPKGFSPHHVGGHLRHVVEFYQCFLDGLESLNIDYDARKRDESIERSRESASQAIRSVIHQLETSPFIQGDAIVSVRMEDAGAAGIKDKYMDSSVSRELQVLSSHTIHHFALIAMTLRLHGIAVDPEFGMSPATLRHLAAKAASAEAA